MKIGLRRKLSQEQTEEKLPKSQQSGWALEAVERESALDIAG